MKNQINATSNDKGKIIAVFLLFATSIIIILSGLTFSIYSFITDSNFRVLTATVPGFVFGLVVTFLGVRYFLSVRKLKIEVFKDSSTFSWSNFKKQKPNVIKSR